MVKTFTPLISAGFMALAAMIGLTHAQATPNNSQNTLWMFEESILQLNQMLGCNASPSSDVNPTTVEEMNTLIISYLHQITDCLLSNTNEETDADELQKRALSYETIIITLTEQIGCNSVTIPNFTGDTQSVLSGLNQFKSDMTSCAMNTIGLGPHKRDEMDTEKWRVINEHMNNDVSQVEARDFGRWKDIWNKFKGKHSSNNEEEEPCEEEEPVTTTVISTVTATITTTFTSSVSISTSTTAPCVEETTSAGPNPTTIIVPVPTPTTSAGPNPTTIIVPAPTPTISDEPTFEEPCVEEPVAEEPCVEEPVSEEPNSEDQGASMWEMMNEKKQGMMGQFGQGSSDSDIEARDLSGWKEKLSGIKGNKPSDEDPCTEEPADEFEDSESSAKWELVNEKKAQWVAKKEDKMEKISEKKALWMNKETWAEMKQDNLDMIDEKKQTTMDQFGKGNSEEPADEEPVVDEPSSEDQGSDMWDTVNEKKQGIVGHFDKGNSDSDIEARDLSGWKEKLSGMKGNEPSDEETEEEQPCEEEPEEEVKQPVDKQKLAGDWAKAGKWAFDLKKNQHNNQKSSGSDEEPCDSE